MKRIFGWLWQRGIMSNFLAGLFVLLPVALTVGIVSWVGGMLLGVIGPGTVVGNALEKMGLTYVTNEKGAWVLGAIFVLIGIWVLGLLLRITARHKFDELFNAAINRIPVVNAIYKPVSQVVGLIKGDDKADMKGMQVAYCRFGGDGGCGFLGLLASGETFTIGEQACRLIYIPTSPVPMSGGLLFVPTGSVTEVDMTVDDVMKIYFSLGVLASQVVPEQYRQARAG
jgi:uncharacterized membrane protein